MTNPEVQAFFHAPSSTFSYVAWDPATRAAAVLDPALDYEASSGRSGHQTADQLVAFVKANALGVAWVIETHVHADHLSAAPYVRSQLGGKLGIGEHIRSVQETFGTLFNAGSGFARDGSQFDHLFTDGEQYQVGSIAATALHTPGHTAACMTHVIGDAAFVGDTLFAPNGGTGRCDFPGADAATQYRSIRRLYDLPDSTRVFLCHDYPAAGAQPVAETTIAAQKAGNIQLRAATTEDEYVAFRHKRDATLAAPRLLYPSLQVNIRAGRLPPADAAGRIFLRLPVRDET